MDSWQYLLIKFCRIFNMVYGGYHENGQYTDNMLWGSNMCYDLLVIISRKLFLFIVLVLQTDSHHAITMGARRTWLLQTCICLSKKRLFIVLFFSKVKWLFVFIFCPPVTNLVQLPSQWTTSSVSQHQFRGNFLLLGESLEFIASS